VIGWLEQRFNLTEMFSFLTNFGLFPADLDTRLPLRDAIRESLERPMPSYARWPRVLGILALLLFAFLGITGVMLAFYYQPTPSQAYESVTILVRDVTFGWFVHQVHRWGAQLLLLILLARLWRFYFQGVYRAPREALWVVAVLMFLVAAQSDLTGRLLGWSAGGYWTSVRAMELLYALPLLGPVFAFLVGGSSIDSLVLLRFYFLHVVVLPGLLIGLFFINFSGVRRVGLSADPRERRGGSGVYQRYLFNLLILAVLILGGLVTLATLAPNPFEKPADPYSTPPGARPPWYLLASYGFMESFPAFVPRSARGFIVELILAACLLVPWIDRSAGRALRERRVAIAAGIVVLLAWAFFTWQGYRMESLR
jgi:quinol-cytochrome oxidoreductase complex cytochrome b subunit